MIKPRLIFFASLALASFNVASQTQTSIKTMETLGFKIGDTSAQVEKNIISQVYVAGEKSMHPPGLGLPDRVVSKYARRRQTITNQISASSV